MITLWNNDIMIQKHANCVGVNCYEVFYGFFEVCYNYLVKQADC